MPIALDFRSNTRKTICALREDFAALAGYSPSILTTVTQMALATADFVLDNAIWFSLTTRHSRIPRRNGKGSSLSDWSFAARRDPGCIRCEL